MIQHPPSFRSEKVVDHVTDAPLAWPPAHVHLCGQDFHVLLCMIENITARNNLLAQSPNIHPRQPNICVGGIMVSIAAFQAVDPGSIPGRRKTFVASVHLFIYIQELGQYPHGKKNISVTGN